MKRSQVLVLRALVCEQPPGSGVDRRWSIPVLAGFLNSRYGDADVSDPFSERAVRCSLEKFKSKQIVWFEGDNWHVDARRALREMSRHTHNPVFGADCRDIVDALSGVVNENDPVRMIFELLGDRFDDEQLAVIREVLDVSR